MDSLNWLVDGLARYSMSRREGGCTGGGSGTRPASRVSGAISCSCGQVTAPTQCRLLEVMHVPQFTHHPAIQIWLEVESTATAILQFHINAVIGERVTDWASQYIAILTKGRSCRAACRCGRLRIGQQFIVVQLDPSLHQAQLLAWQVARQDLTVVEADGSLEFGVLGMQMRQRVLHVVNHVQTDDDAEEHRDDRHNRTLLGVHASWG